MWSATDTDRVSPLMANKTQMAWAGLEIIVLLCKRFSFVLKETVCGTVFMDVKTLKLFTHLA